MAPPIRFCVLGPMRAGRDDLDVDLGSPQQQAVLAMLLLREGRLTLSTELIAAIWGDTPPRAAAGTIRTYISRLRPSLELPTDDPAVRIDSLGGGYALHLVSGTLDHTLFREHLSRARTARKNADPAAVVDALQAAITLCTGTPLAGVPGPYAESQRAGMQQALLTTRAQRLAALLELGRHAEAVPELSALAVEHPLREQFRELLMLALYRSGRTADALAVFQSVQQRLTDDLGIDPGPRLQDLHRRILAGDPTLFDLRPIRTAGPPNPTGWLTPRQLPADLPDFTGREAELGAITEALTRPDAVPVVAIAGMGGVGKTALAVHAAHRVQAHFPDGQVFVQLDALSDQPADPHEILANLLRTFRAGEEPLPPSLAERAALWRTTISGRRVLIVLDDAEDNAQVQGLLPATPGCAVILTGRRRILDLPGSDWITLGVFAPDEALALLGRMAGPDRVAAETGAARDLASSCSHIPHAVRLAGARLVARPDWSVADIQRRVADEIREMNQLSAGYADCIAVAIPFARGYRQLDPDQARAFRLLAVPDGRSISTAAAAAMLEVTEAEAENLLESLANVHLIEAGARGRYRYYELVRKFGRYRALLEDGPTITLAAVGRLVRFYHASARNTLLTLDPATFAGHPIPGGGLIFATRRAAEAWLLLERDNIGATVRQASAQAGELSPSAAEALHRLTPLVRRFSTDPSHPSSREIYDLLALAPAPRPAVR